MDLGDAQAAAQAAADAAKAASDAAAAAVAAQEANKDADAASYGIAKRAADDAMAAYMAAKAASDAAGAAATSAAAQAQQAVAEAEQGDAADALADAVMYAGMVQVAQDALDEAAALMAAQDAAQAAADAARAAATTAQEAADKVAELAGAGAPATAAQADADAADTAATAAEAANTAAQAAETSDVAAGHQEAAEDAQADAMTSQMYAAEKQREAQVASNVASEQQEARDIKAAQDAAGAAATAAQVSYVAAEDAATAARGKANDAEAAAKRARQARTQVGKVGTEDDPATPEDESEDGTGALAAERAAGEAADAAEAERDAALAAMNAANDANTAAMGATTSDDAEMYQGNAETAQGNAAMAATTAMTQRDNAVTAAKDAETAANTHVLGLFTQANAYDIDTEIIDDSSTAEVNEAESVEMQQTAERKSVGGAIATSADMPDGARDGDVTATVAWAEDDADPTPTLDGTLSGDADAATIMSIPGVGDFVHGFSVMRPATDETNTANMQLLVFTDKVEETDAEDMPESAAVLRNVPVEDQDDVEALGDSTDDGKTYPGTLDNDADAVMGLVKGTFTCAGDPDSCTVVYTGTGDNRIITEFDGFTFSGTRDEVVAADANLQNDYLVFGIWLQEANPSGEDTSGDDTFGAFYGGGTGYAIGDDVSVAISGTATYSGAAVGAHHITDGPVSYFDGSATLMAKFGNATDAGTIEGSIDDIWLDGEEYPDVIRLVQTSLGLDNTTAGVFNGSAVMDPQTAPGQASHSYNGTYSGQFFGASEAIEDDPDTEDVVEATVAAGTRMPAAVAGSFGVTRTLDMDTMDMDDDITESFVGAFGARFVEPETDPMNGN